MARPGPDQQTPVNPLTKYLDLKEQQSPPLFLCKEGGANPFHSSMRSSAHTPDLLNSSRGRKDDFFQKLMALGMEDSFRKLISSSQKSRQPQKKERRLGISLFNGPQNNLVSDEPLFSPKTRTVREGNRVATREISFEAPPFLKSSLQGGPASKWEQSRTPPLGRNPRQGGGPLISSLNNVSFSRKDEQLFLDELPHPGGMDHFLKGLVHSTPYRRRGTDENAPPIQISTPTRNHPRHLQNQRGLHRGKHPVEVPRPGFAAGTFRIPCNFQAPCPPP